MRVPVEWLREYVDVGLKSKDLADRLTMAGAEVSAIEFHGKGIEGVVVGKVKSIETHPRADDLNIVQIDVGTKLLQLITNLKTLKVGDKVPVAKNGAKLANDIHVEVRELHGVESFGMLCSLEHLGLAEESIDVMKLDKNAPLGENIKNVIGIKGTILEVDVLPNRGDLLSIVGVAREISAVLNKNLKPKKSIIKETTESIEKKINIEIKDSDLCSRYMARVIEGVEIKESPSFIRDRLVACGLRPINNIVDITNYVLIEMGQPLHAFDLDKIMGKKIIVRRAKSEEEIVTLDGEKRKLKPDMLVIADKNDPVALAGVMGGSSSEVTDATVNILLESAYFNPASINKTSRSLKIRTDSSARFERGVDFHGVEEALNRAASLISEHCGGKICKGFIDKNMGENIPKIVNLRVSFLNKILGIALSKNAIELILKRLGFIELKSKGADIISVEVPSFRVGDVDREIDLVEEVARIHGYEKIKDDMPRIAYNPRKEDSIENSLDKIREVIKGFGFFEVQTFSIISPKEISVLPFDDNDLRKMPITISNPLSEDVSVMRTMLVQNLLRVLSRNFSRQSKDLAIFEIGNVYLKSTDKMPNENLSLGMAISGDVFRNNFKITGSEDVSFYLLKAAIESLFEVLGVKGFCFNPEANELLENGKSSIIKAQDSVIGFLGRAASSLQSEYDLPGNVYIAELDIRAMLKLAVSDKRYKPLAKYPKVTRDIAMFVSEDVSHANIINLIKEIGAPLLENVRIFDSYKGKQVPKGCQGLAYELNYRDFSKTLTDSEVNSKHDLIIKELINKFGVQIRDK